MKRPKVVALATRMKLTPTQQTAFTEVLVEEAGGDVSKIAKSYATADRSRRAVVSHISSAVKSDWIPPVYCSVHWDSKLLVNKSAHVSEERLTVAVGNEAGIKFLGAPSYKPGTNQAAGDLISKNVVDLLESWQCTGSVVYMVFDTTASNTGHVSAACIAIQQRLNKPLLWSACRHHVGELILSQVFNDLKIEVSKSPDVQVFSRFQKQFGNIPHDNLQELSPFIIDNLELSEEVKAEVEDWKRSVIALAESVVSHLRDDYKEFTELCLMFLSPENRKIIHWPGAMHKARWMAKLLYSIKMVLLETQIDGLPKGSVTTRHQSRKLREFVNFVCLIYAPWWLTCSSAVDAPWHDIVLFRRLISYCQVNIGIANSALKALQRHLWYLTSEMVPLALFSSVVPVAEKQSICDQLQLFPPQRDLPLPHNRFGSGFGKPKFPENISSETSLGELVGQDSWFFFQVLGMNTEFLSENVDLMHGNANFQSALKNITAVNVVNDSAERGVKLSSDFLEAARQEEHYQNILQVVEKNRKEKPNLRLN